MTVVTSFSWSVFSLEKKVFLLKRENEALRGSTGNSFRTSHSTSPTPPSFSSCTDKSLLHEQGSALQVNPPVVSYHRPPFSERGSRCKEQNKWSQSVSQSVSDPVSQPASQPVSQSVSQSVSTPSQPRRSYQSESKLVSK